MKVKIDGEVEKTETVETPEAVEEEAIAEDTQPSAEEIAAEEAERLRKMELENAELRGQNQALKSFQHAATAPDQSQRSQMELKKTVLSDVNSLSDDDFRAKYKFEKFQATAAILEQEFQSSDARNKQEIAELKAENRLVAKYGKEFTDARKNVDEIVAMASAETRQDPARLERLMEGAFLAVRGGKAPALPPVKGKGATEVRKIVSMEKPTPAPSGGRKEGPTDALPEEYQKLGRAFGITSEKERKALLESNYVPMNLGNGLVFRDPAKGVEKIETPA